MWKAMGTLNILGVNSPRSLAPFSIGFGFNFNLDPTSTQKQEISQRSQIQRHVGNNFPKWSLPGHEIGSSRGNDLPVRGGMK